jgi:hypothetical protein
MNAVPTPRFDVGENVFAAQLLQGPDSVSTCSESSKRKAYMTSGKRL